MSLTLYAAVDVAAGKTTNVPAGRSDDPLQVALGLAEAGADWLHIVDLDQAFRRGENLDLLRDLIAAVDVPVQLSGGIDSAATLRAAASTGARRINLASTVMLGKNLELNCDFIAAAHAEYGDRVVVGIDVRAKAVVARGSNVEVGSVAEVVSSVAETGASEFVVADASRDGSRKGADAAMFGWVSDALRRVVPTASVVASGGVGTLADLTAIAHLKTSGVGGVVLGAALHHGAFTLAQAREAVGT